jgi:uncharacterized membrane protein YfhO
VYQNSNLTIGLAPENDVWPDNYNLWQDEVVIKPYTYYMVDIELESNVAETGYVYVDFYGENYDIMPAQQNLNMEQRDSSAILFSDNSDICNNVLFRIVSINNIDNINVVDVKLYEIIPSSASFVYKPYIVNDQTRIFENMNARDILYFSNELKQIPNVDYIYANLQYNQFDKISYVVGTENKIFDTAENSIKDIDFKNNTITASVSSPSGGFLNFSQCYFPGWRVYVDGNRSDLKIVNALIMGVEIPEGNHTVEFKFVDMGFIVGLILTCASISLLIACFVVKPKLRKEA